MAVMDLKDALLLLYIIMVASYMEPLFSCDLQRLFTQSILAKHCLAFISAFFLVTLVSDNEAQSLFELMRTTLAIYVLYLLSTKAKAYFVLPMLIALFADQIMRVQIQVIDKREREARALPGDASLRALLDRTRGWLTWVIVGLIVTGTIHYYLRARADFGDRFSNVVFLVGTKRCQGM
jgi:hypothetical protein